ncbi:hypothetical protein [Stenotrophomonas rhizophila]|nr:hypothetical protein [Stenotrophomonas rhizophila]
MADWVAALGTWAIGAAAVAIAWLTHRRQEDEVRSSRQEKLAARRKGLRLLQHSAEDCTWLQLGLNEQRSAGALSLEFLRNKLMAAIAIYTPIRFDLDGLDVSEDVLNATRKVRRSLVSVIKNSEMFLDEHTSEPFDEKKSEKLEWLIENTDSLAENARTLLAALEVELSPSSPLPRPAPWSAEARANT